MSKVKFYEPTEEIKLLLNLYVVDLVKEYNSKVPVGNRVRTWTNLMHELNVGIGNQEIMKKIIKDRGFSSSYDVVMDSLGFSSSTTNISSRSQCWTFLQNFDSQSYLDHEVWKFIFNSYFHQSSSEDDLWQVLASGRNSAEEEEKEKDNKMETKQTKTARMVFNCLRIRGVKVEPKVKDNFYILSFPGGYLEISKDTVVLNATGSGSLDISDEDYYGIAGEVCFNFPNLVQE